MVRQWQKLFYGQNGDSMTNLRAGALSAEQTEKKYPE